MRTPSIVLFVCVLLAFTPKVSAQSNEGREFWLGFMEHRDANNTKVLMLTSRVNTSGTISMPGQNFSMNFNIAANDVTLFELPRTAETIGSEFINDNGIRITSQNDISVYMHQYFGMRSEASVVLPRSSVSNSYYVIGYTGVPPGVFGSGGPYPSEFLIVANEDETNIDFTLTANTQSGRTIGQEVSILLNAGEVYQVRSSSWDEDLTGTFITGDKDFSVFAGAPWAQVPQGCTAMDNLLEQMYPIDTWGTKYVASSFSGTSQDLYRIMAAEDNTEVDIQGSIPATVELDAGEYYETTSTSGAYIESTNPISVAQYIIGSGCNGGIGDPSMVILNTVEQIRDTVTLFNSRFENIDQNFINVICKAGEEDLVFIDNQKVTDQGVSFNTIGNDGDFLFAIIPTSVGPHTLFTSGCGIIAMAYGYGNVESYAYSGGASFTKINENPIPEGGCLNDTIQFDTGLPEERYAVLWDLGDGNTTTAHTFEQIYSTLDTFDISLIIEDLCFDEVDTIYRELKVSLRQNITAFDDQSGCEGSNINLGAFDLEGARFEWTGPAEFVAEEQFPTIEEISIDEEGIYQVVGNVSGCKTIPLEIFVEVFEKPLPNLGIDTVLCTLDGDRFTLNGGNYASFIWQDGSEEPTYEVQTEGIFHIEVTDNNNCTGLDSILIQRQCPTRFYIPNVFSPNGDGINDFFGVSEIEMISMELNVYDRWGQLIFQSKESDFMWDGNFDNQPVQTGEYIWTMEYEGYTADASIFSERVSGTILLTR